MNQQLAVGFAVGVGCALLIPVIGMAVAAGGARPMGRALARGGAVFGEKTRETLAELCEVYEDFMAEARAGARSGGYGEAPGPAADAGSSEGPSNAAAEGSPE